MRRIWLPALAILLLTGSPAAADEPFPIPRLSVVEIDESRGSVVVFDADTRRHARLALGGFYDRELRLVRVHGDRIVLRRTGTHVYYVFPVHGDMRVRDREPSRQRARASSALLPLDPYGDPYREGENGARYPHHPGSERPSGSNGGVLDPFAYAPSRHVHARPEGYDQRPISAYDGRDRQPDIRGRGDFDLPQPISPYGRFEAKEREHDHRGPAAVEPINPYEQRHPRRYDERAERDVRPLAPDYRERDRHPRPVNPYDPRDHQRHHQVERAPTPAAPAPAQAPGDPMWPREVSRARLDATLSDFRALERQIAIRSEGTGVRIISLATHSLMYDMGLRQGDLIQRVAGRQLDTVEAAAALYAHLARTDRFEVELVREGRPVVLHYRLVP
jgi:hypothetical protein